MNVRSGFLTVLFLLIPVSFFICLLFFLNKNSSNSHITFVPQKPQLFVIGSSPTTSLSILATTLPQFAVKLADEKFKNLWQAHAAEQEDLVNSSVRDTKGDNLQIHTVFDAQGKQVVVTPQTQNGFKPGLYTLNVKVKTYSGQDITVSQDFTWGVLAINTGKAYYLQEETVKIGMGVLDDLGNTKCIAKGDITYDTARVWLTIISPSGKKQDLSTDAGTIVGSRECAPISVTDNPDFQAQIVAQEIGRYTIHMTAENINGRRSIDDYFMVQQTPPPFDIMRTSYPTRIYPYGHYPVELTVIANQDYSGTVSDVVPNNFQILHISDGGVTDKNSEYQQINWQVVWTKGQTYTLGYEIKFPLVSPEFYLVGPLTIGNFSEGREWQIASDTIQQAQTPVSNVVNSGLTVSATLGSALTGNNLIIVICSETGSATISTMPRNGGNSWSSTSITSTPRMRFSYRVIRSTDSNSLTCTFSSSTGVKAIQIFEYSGLATTTVRDLSKTHNGACSSSPFTFTSNTSTFTITNPVELIVASFVSTTARTVNSHAAGYTTDFAFSGSSGTFSTAEQTTSSIADYTDTITFSGNAGTCSAAILSFITAVNLTQNSFQFFDNANSTTPGSAIGSQNDPLTLPAPHYPFRLRFLVDVDGNQTVSLGQLDFILQYAVSPSNGDCSTLNDTDWNPITSSSPIAYNTNSLSGGSGTSISSSGSDPTDTHTTVLEDYYESFAGDGTDDISNLQNTLSASSNQAGLWDVSLVDNTDDTQSTTYCLEVANGAGDGTVSGNLDSYVHYPQVTTFYNEVNIKSGTTINGGTNIY